MQPHRKVSAALLAALACAPLATIDAAAGGSPSADPADEPRLLGSEVLLWQFDADDLDTLWPGSVRDHGPYASHGTMFDAARLTAGPNGFGLAYRGLAQPDRVDASNGSVMAQVGPNYSIAMWARPDALATTTALLQVRAASNLQLVTIEVTSTGAVTLVQTNPSAIAVDHVLGPAGTLKAGVWTHLAFVLRATPSLSVALVVDGTTANVLPRSAMYAQSPPAGLRLGGTFCCTASFVGALDEVRVFRQALVNEDIRDLMARPYFHPNSAPVADAGEDLAAGCTGPLTRVGLDASGSSDPEGDPLAFAWSAAEADAIADAGAAVTEATFPVGTSRASVAVSDGEFTATDEVRVMVVDAAPPVLTSVAPGAPGVYHADLGVVAGEDIVIVAGANVTAEASDLCSEVAFVRFEVDDGTVVVDAEAPHGFTYAPYGLGVQYRRLSVVAVDAWGNASPPTVRELTVVAAAMPA